MTVQETVNFVGTTEGVRVRSAAETTVPVLQYERLEAQSWAPWLRFSRAVLTEHVRAFPEEQFFAFDVDGLVGALSTNRIAWTGDRAALGSWDSVAGERQDYRDTHVADGNTLVTMSMSVARRARGRGVTGHLFDAVLASATDRGIDHVIGTYRPFGYGSFKMHDGTGFLGYVDLQDDRGLPLDPWLRSLTRMGMERMKVDERAMVVDVTLREFERLRRTSSSLWVRTADARDVSLHRAALSFPVAECEFWEAEQAGTWYVHRPAERAVYVESGVWGAVVLDGRKAG